jgi:hypothetical protein
MRVLDKRKDFWDYQCYAYGPNPGGPVYDRSKGEILTDDNLCRLLLSPGRSSVDWLFFERRTLQPVFQIEMGFNLYAIKLISYDVKKVIVPHTHLECNTFVNAKFEIVGKQTFTEHHYSKPITLTKVRRKLPTGINYSWHHRHEDWFKENAKFSELEWLPETHSFCYADPVFRDCGLAGCLNPLEIYQALDMYLGSLGNDKPAESINPALTDVDKAINHGFDKKESFRNIK